MTTVDYQATVSKTGFTPVNITLSGPQPVKHSFDKMIYVVDVPKQNPPYSLLIDLKKLRETVTFTGYLEDEDADPMWTKRTNLRRMLQDGGDFYVKWDRNDPNQWSGLAVNSGTWQGYQGNLMKCDITEDIITVGDTDETKSFGITFQFIIGRTKG